MISANRKMFVTNKLEINGIKTTAAPAGHIGNFLAKLRKMVLGF
jgi:hypothetical protein